jgi:hypothetical protein
LERAVGAHSEDRSGSPFTVERERREKASFLGERSVGIYLERGVKESILERGVQGVHLERGV